MDRVKTGVIGVGTFGKIHAQIYQELPDALLLGIYDVDIEKSQMVAKELGVIAFNSAEDLIAEVDAVSVVTPTKINFSLANKILEQGKHLLVEKLPSHSVMETEHLLELAKQNNCIIQVGHYARYNAALQALDDIKLSPHYMEANRQYPLNKYEKEVDIVRDIMIQDIDLILTLANSKPQTISAKGVAVMSSSIDTVTARIEFENGAVANLTTSKIATKQTIEIRLFQKDAYILMDFVEGCSEIFYLVDKNPTPFRDGTLALSLGKIQSREIKYNRLKREQVNPLKNELRNYIVSIKNELPVLVSAEEGLEALKVANIIAEKITAQAQSNNSQQGDIPSDSVPS